MFCSAADGTFLPPMIIYKGIHLKKEWTVGGPTGAYYAMTPSGWFNLDTFEDWFFKVSTLCDDTNFLSIYRN